MVTEQQSVDLISITSNTKTIQMCFQQCLYEVPLFQRPYSWEEDQLEDFWKDVVLAEGDFFFGSTVTWVSEERGLFRNTYSLIDGQQRLTTCTILLSVIRNSLQRIADHQKEENEVLAQTARNQAAATQRYLTIEDDNGESYNILKRPEDMFYEFIQNQNAVPSNAKWGSSGERIGSAQKFFEGKVNETLVNLKPEQQVDTLKGIRSNTLKARVIQVELGSEEDAFLIFETLNTRGTELLLADLVKNLLVREGSNKEQDRKNIVNRWSRIVEEVERNNDGRDAVDRFIWQSWCSRRAEKKQSELFKEIKSVIAKKELSCIDYLNELEEDSVIYGQLGDTKAQTRRSERGKRSALSLPTFIDSVRALAIFNVSVANSAVLALARKYNNKGLSATQLTTTLRMIEALHFQHFLVSGGATGGTRSRYNRFAVDIETAKPGRQVKDVISTLQGKLKGSLPTRDKVHDAFVSLVYAPRLTLPERIALRSRQAFISYVLMSFAKNKKTQILGQDPSTWSIEHIKPQSEASRDYRDPVYSIGNLTLLSRELNSDIGNRSYADKIESLRQGSAFFDSALSEWETNVGDFPSDGQIADRARRLADEALNEVWNID